MASPIVTATSRNPTFFPANPSVDLFANVNVITDGDDIDELVLTVTNVLLGANERLIIDGTIIELTDGNLETTGSNIGVSVSLSGTIATVTITPPAGFDATELAALIDGMQYENISATPGTARRVVTLTSVSDTNGPDDTAALSISSTASPSTVIELVSVSTDGVQVTSAPQAPLDTLHSVSSDGRFVVFVGSDPNLVAGDTNGFNDIYLRDRLEGTTVRVNLASDELQTTGVGPLINSSSPSISDDGRFVAFITAASLVANDINAVPDLYVRDLLNGTTIRVSIGTSGVEGNIAVNDGEISGSGLFAAFTSFADTLLGPGGDTNGVTDVFVRDLTGLTTERVSVADNEAQADGASSFASISANGTRIAFQSTATNLIGVGNDTNGLQDIFVRDTVADSTVRISVGLGGVAANGTSFSASISGDGTRVAFVSAASNLVASDTNGFEDIFVRDIAAGTTIRISSPDFIGASINPSISANGRFVTFENDFNIWAYDIQTAQLLRLTVPTSGLNSNSSRPIISGDGSTVVFFDGNNDLVPSDSNAPLIQDVFAAPLSFSQPPTLDLDASAAGTGFTASYTENDAIGVLIADSDVTITDADVGDMIESATVTVQNPLADDQLTLGDQAGFAITGSGTSIITIIGTGTVDQYEAIIQQIRFLNTGEDPTVGGTRNTRSINSVVNDGTSNSPTAITTVNITAINDEPTFSATGLTPTFTEGGAAVGLFNGAAASTIEAGERFASLTLTVSNVADGLTPGADEILTINGVDVALSDGNSVPLGGSAGTATVSLINNIATVTVSGANLLAGPLQTLVDGITYRNITVPNPSLADRVITITDVVDTGSNVPLNDNTADPNIAATVHIAAANDAPDADIAPPTFGPVDENVALDLKNSGLSVSDVDAGGGIEKVTLSVTEGILNVTPGNSGATVTDSGSASVTIEGTIAQINALLNTDLASTVSYVDNNDAPAATVTLTLAIDDQGNSGTGGPLIDQDTADISITAVNDKPDVTAPASYTGLSSTAITINNITFADVDGLGASEQATFAAATGTFLAADAFGVTVTGSGSGTITLSGSTADLTTFIAANQLTYTVAATETITLTLNDQGNTGNGGAQSDVAMIQVNIGAPPVIADLAGDTSTFVEDGAAVLLDDSSPPEVAATVTDDDSANFDTGNLTVSIIGNLVTNEDVLGITTTANVTLNGSDVLVDSVVIGTVTGGNLGSDLVVTFNANATPDAVGFLINALTYSNSNTINPLALQRTIAVTISDGDGAISNSEQVLVNVASVNEAPILLALNGDEAVFTENGPAVNVDVGANAGVSDSDSPDFDTGSLTVSITSGKVAAEDQLNIVDTGLVTVIPPVITPRFTIPGTVLVNGTTIGTITSPGGPGGDDLVITFNSAATPGAIAQLIQAIEYFNSGGDAPTAGVRGITYTLVDGDGQANGGADTATANTTVTVNAVNDDPAAAGVPTDITVTEDLSSNVDLSAITLTDGDSGLDNITLTLAASAGTLTAADGGGVTVGGSGSGSLTLTGTVAEIDAFLDIATSIKYTTALNAAGDNVATLTLTANDGGHNGMGGGGDVALGIVNIDSIAVNDAPVNQILLAPTNVTEDFASPIAGIVFTDVDAGGGTVLATLSVASGSINAISGGGVTVGGSSSARTLAGTIADINAFIAGSNLTFTTASNAVASVDLTVTLNDGGNTGIDPGLTGDGGSEEDTDVLTLAVGAVNDAPALAGLDNVPVFIENSASVVLDDNATISDSELDAADNYGGAMLTLARNGGANPQDSFGTSGTLSFSGGNVLIGATTVGTFTNAGGQLQIIFNGNATSALADSVLQQITYSNSSDNPPTSAQINYTVSDGNAGGQGTGPTPGLGFGSITVNITAVNDAPILGGVPTSRLLPADGAALNVAPALTVGDVDSSSLTSATVRVSAGSFVGANDVLAANTAGTSITAFYDPATETLTLSGSDTLAHYQQVLASVTFDTTDTNPGNSGLNPTRTIEWQLNDGSGANNLSSIATTTINVSQQSPSDFNGDAVSDVLWRLNNGFVAEWLMSDGAISQNLGVAQPDPVWHFQDTGDFGADGMADILWRHDNGQAVLWQMDGATILSNQSVAVIGNDWHNEGVADFGGDGRADVLWHNDSGQVALWTMDGAQITNNQSVGNIDASWHVQGLLDTGGDGKSDVLLRNDSGQVVLWTMDGAQITNNQSVTNNLGLDWNIVGTGDFGGDGKGDVLLRNDSGQVVIWTMDGNQIVDNQSVGTPGNEWQVQDVGDYNLDGKSDVLWRNDSGQVVLWEMNGNQIVSNHTVTNQGGAPAPIGLEWTVQNHHYDVL